MRQFIGNEEYEEILDLFANDHKNNYETLVLIYSKLDRKEDLLKALIGE